MADDEKKETLQKLALILAGHVDNLQRLASTWGEDISEVFSQTDEEIIALITAACAEYAGAGKLSARRIRTLKELKGKIRQIRSQCSEEAYEKLEENIEKLIRNEDKWSRAWLLAMLALLPAEKQSGAAVKSVSESRMDDIRTKGIYNGDTVKGLFSKITDLDVSRLIAGAEQALTKSSDDENGMSLSAVKEIIKKNLEKTARQIGVNITGIVNGISNDTVSMFAEKNKAVASGVMWITALDERVCDDCASMEGQVFEPASAPMCPAHFNCRCHLVPVVKGVDF